MTNDLKEEKEGAFAEPPLIGDAGNRTRAYHSAVIPDAGLVQKPFPRWPTTAYRQHWASKPIIPN
ncbi:MAG TPA: hypothetical protein VI937_02510 [Negativicutes bacterium]|uniref:Uncharacterized protein n=1 Tax=Candidatus Staskawiczbacteria bacterium RIFCSPHIGHO2_01_FULL_41_41 TaxID=1802203 RepID=A0A1G2HUX8_9BACT|nr:MAG: hypothetical protein A2822_02155 [Candidatus Staskawiczbacteria bacterium RIFCSPHIGHO2_01_FULL_41_41]OGZ69127.1 MAG: hypothetical protein A3C50_01895 [Candidatus Staskawiczbacteria bacterium RIFCSPHIGHO2_02_FULL_43_16]OGZ74445.1 MAG: hypothetical protein A3A12_01595 [Candidatus Staskawiczbacteria bacterium RIFCSPLOWO2_01_FULL_43_17b]HLD70729.1 hypothetical protein [Negativicutes bacterium]